MYSIVDDYTDYSEIEDDRKNRILEARRLSNILSIDRHDPDDDWDEDDWDEDEWEDDDD